jgi:hypothetical protein
VKDEYNNTSARATYEKHRTVFLNCGLLSNNGFSALSIHFYKQEMFEGVYDEDLISRDDLEKARVFLNDLLFAGAVDAFNAYLSDIILEILKQDPRPIYGKQFDAKFLFEVNDITSLRAEMINRLIVELGYQSITDLTVFLEKNFGLMSLSSWLTKLRLNRMIQIRNIVTHNRGIANKLYLHRSKSKIDSVDEHVRVAFSLRAAKYLDRLVEKLDQEVASKFDISEN